MSRFIVIQASVSGHCCFEASVHDTYAMDHWNRPEHVCECFSERDAIAIAESLNFLQGEPTVMSQDEFNINYPVVGA